MSQEEESDWTFGLIYGEPLDCRGSALIDISDPLADDPVGLFIANIIDERSLAKNGGVDSSWDEPIGARRRVELSKSFLERSDRRFERVVQKIRAFFGEHVEEAEAAIELARDARDEVRQEFIVS